MSLPTASTPGYGLFRGRVACHCLQEWLPVYERELQRRGILSGPLSIYQLTGAAAASADTHSAGGVFDIVNLPGDEDVWVARQMGADATWDRATMSPRHIHGVLRGCPHNGPARYQISAVDAGFNGLGVGGRGGPDDGPRPLSARTWREGIDWQRQQEDWFTMATKDDLRKVIDDALAAYKAELITVTTAKGKTRTLSREQWEREVFQKAARAAAAD